MNEAQNSYLIRLHTDASKPDTTSHRLAVIRWKSGKDKTTKQERPKLTADRCVSIPKLTINVQPVALQTVLQSAFEDMQDSVIRAFIENQLAGKPANSELPNRQIPAEELTAEAVANYITETNSGGKLSKALIEAWFNSSLKENLELALVERLGDGATDQQLATTIENYRLSILKLSSPQANFSETTATQLQKALSLANSDTTTDKLLKKVSGFLKPRTETILDVL